MNWALGDIPSWLTAIATGGAWTAAGISLHRERTARLKLEGKDRERQIRDQALKISAWYGGSTAELKDSLVLLNRSDAPVYGVVATMVFVQGAAPRTGEEINAIGKTHDHVCLMALPPGTWRVGAPEGWAGMYRRPGAEIAFTDAAGAHWVRRASGALEALQEEPFEHFKIPRPIDLRMPTPS